MSRGFAVRVSLTAIAIASIAIVLLQTLGFWSGGVLPIDVIQQSNGPYVVHRDINFPLPSPLADGDVLAPREMTSAARAATFYGLGVPVGSSVDIAVYRGGRILRASVTAQPAPPLGRDLLGHLVTAFLTTPFLAALALLTLWRGHDRVAAGLCALSLYGLIASAMLSLSTVLVEPLATVWLVLVAVEAQYLFALPGLYVMAEGLAGAGVSVQARRLARAVVACLGAVALGLDVTREISSTYYGLALSPVVPAAIQAFTLTLIAIPVLMLFAGYRRAPHESRLRIRWVLWSTAFLLVCALAVFALEPVQTRYPYLFEFVYTARLLCMGGYLYAAIRTRLVDVSFIVNRALVYAAITGLLFGIFSLLELGLHEFAVGDKLSWVLQAIVALLLAMALSPLHRRLDHWVERFFFRKQRLAIAALRTFAAECAFIEQQSRLLETAVERLRQHCDAVAIYERALAGYQLRGSTRARLAGNRRCRRSGLRLATSPATGGRSSRACKRHGGRQPGVSHDRRRDVEWRGRMPSACRRAVRPGRPRGAGRSRPQSRRFALHPALSRAGPPGGRHCHGAHRRDRSAPARDRDAGGRGLACRYFQGQGFSA